MVQTATNRKTGERIALIDGTWVPITKTASNPKTGGRLGLAGDTWVPLNDKAASALAMPPATPTPPPAAQEKPEEQPGFFEQIGRSIKSRAETLFNLPQQIAAQSFAGPVNAADTQRKIFDAIDRGEYKPKFKSEKDLEEARKTAAMVAGQAGAAGMGIPIAAGPDTQLAMDEAAFRYYKAKPEERAAMRGEAAKITEKVAPRFERALQRVEEAEERARPLRAKTTQVSDIDSWASFKNYVGGVIGETAVQLPITMAAGAVGGPGGAFGASTGMTYGAETVNRIAFAREKYKDLPPEKQAAAIATYLRDSGDVVAISAAVQGSLDLFGPVGTVLQRKVAAQLGKDGVRDVLEAAAKRSFIESTKQEGKAAVKRFPREAGEEALTGGAQEVTSILGERALGEQKGPLLSAENMKRVFESAVAEGIGGGFVGTPTTFTTGLIGSRAETKRAKQTLRQEAEEGRLKEFTAARGEMQQAFQEAVARYKSEGMSDADALRKAGADVQMYVANQRSAGDVPSTVAGGTGPGVPDIVDAGLPGGDAGTAGPTRPGGLGDVGTAAGPDIGVEGAQQRPLKKPTAKQVKAALPTVEQAFADAAIDFEENYGVTELTGAQKQVAARMVVEGVDAYDAIDNLLQKRERAPIVEEAPPVTAAPSVDEVATQPIKQVIETATTPTPGAAVPSIAETAAKEAGIAPTGEAPGPTPEDLLREDLAQRAAEELPAPATVEETVTEAAVEEAPVEEAPTYTPQQIVDNLTVFSGEEARNRGYADDTVEGRMFRVGAGDVKSGTEPLTDELILEKQGPEALQAYKEGMQWGQDTIAAAQAPAAPAVETAPAVTEEAAPAAPVVQELPIEPAPAVEETPVAEEVAPEVDPYEDVLNELEGSFLGDPEEGIEPEIDEKAYNLLKSAVENRRAPPEKIMEELDKARDRYAEQSMRYRRQQAGQGVDPDAVAARVRELTANWKADLNIQVVATIDDLPPTAQDTMRNDNAENAQGFVDEDGTVYLIASNLDSIEDATATLYHETLGHLGLRALFGARLDTVLQQIYDGNKKLRDEADAWNEANPDAYPDDANPQLRALEEVLAAQSEAGQINTGIWSRVTAVVKDFGRRMGLKVNYSDSEMRAILAQAHGKITGGAADTAASGLRYMRKPKKEAVSLTRLKKKLIASHKAAELNVTAGKLFFNARGSKAKIRLLNSVWKTLNTNRRRAALYAFYFNRDILRNVKKYSPPLARTLASIDDTMKKMTGTRNKLLEKLNYEAQRWRKFNAKFKQGGTILSELLNGSTLYTFDPRQHASLADALANDPKMKELVKEGASKRRLDNRREVIEFLYGLYEQLADPKMGNGEGQRLYDMAITNFEKSFDAEHRTIISNIRSSGLSDAVKKDTEKRINEMYQEAKKNSPYAPAYRSGDFWVRIGKGKNRTTFRVESEIAWNYAIEDAIAEIQAGGDTRTAEEIMSDPASLTFGRDIEGLQADFFANEPSDVLKQVFDKLDGGNLADVKAVKDMVFQMYVASLPKKTTLERMQRREGIAGFSADVLRAYTDTQMTAINRLAQLQHARDIRSLVGEAYAYLEGNPDKLLLSPYVDEMASRAGQSLSPRSGVGEYIANMASKVTFFYLLTSIKSQLLQFFQLPFVGLPALVSRYGLLAAMEIAVMYMSTFPRRFGTSKRDEQGNVMTEWGQPTIGDSAYVRKNKSKELGDALQYGWDDMLDRGLAGNTYASDMFARRSRPSEQYETVGARATRAVWDFTTGGMHHIERMSREIMYMSTFELEYKKQRASGVDAKTAQIIAADVAADVTQETMFDYAETSKPRLMKTIPGRIALQFYTFPIQMVSLLARSFMGMVGQMPDRTERAMAAQQFFGTLGMTYMFAGAVGMPGYSFMMGLLQTIIEEMRPDDEPPGEEDEFNPLYTLNLDLWFREWFLPNYFGPDSDIAFYFDLTPEQANTLVRGMKMGPISAATDINFGSSLSMDNMFFRDDAPVDTTQEAAKSMWWTMLGAAGGLINQFTRGVDNIIEGDWQRAAENFAPGFYRGSVVTKRLAEEGYITPSTGDTVKAREEYTTGKLVAQAMGLGSTEVADIQKSNIMAKRTVDGIEKERAKYMDKLDKAFEATIKGRVPAEEGRARTAELWKEIDAWNRRTGYIHEINYDNYVESLETRAEGRAGSIQGLRVPEQYEAVARGALKSRE
jgi:hypothetical protein